MKKYLFFLFASMLLSGCKCVLSQIPPQIIYVNSSCQAVLPDYKTKVSVSGGCTGFALTQTPLPGTILTIANKTTVVIKATGTNGKTSQIQFNVSLADTITPVIIPDTSQFSQAEPTKEMYDLSSYNTMIASEFDSKFPYELLGIARPAEEPNKILLLYHYPGDALKGEAEMWWTLR